MTTYTRSLHKDAYKLAAVAIWTANEMIKSGPPADERKAVLIARRQAGRIMAAVGADDNKLNATLFKYERDVSDFSRVLL